MNKTTAFKVKWLKSKIPLQTDTTIPAIPRKWQLRAFNELINARDVVLNAPTGSGKSFVISYTLSQALTANKNLKTIIAVPQIIIASGFTSHRFKLPDGTIADWAPIHDLCSNKKTQTNGKVIEDFLKNSRAEFLNDRIVICTHASLVKAYEKHKDLFKNVIIVIDEAHHTSFNKLEDDECVRNTNKLGNLVEYAIDNSDLNINIWLTTATFFRTENAIIPAHYTDKFKWFDLAYDEFLKELNHLEQFSFDFLLYKNSNYKSGITYLFKENLSKTVVYIPPVNSRYSVSDKHDDVKEVYKSIGGDNYKEKSDGIITLIYSKIHKKWIKCLNLVDEKNRDLKTKWIIKSHDASHANDIDVIITLNMFIEGANWKWADKLLIVGKRGALKDIMQIIGRLFRDAVGKDKVEICYLLPYVEDIKSEEFRENFNDYFNSIISAMLMLKRMAPKLICPPKPKSIKNDEDNDCENDIEYIDYITEKFPDYNKQHEFIKDCIDTMILTSAENNIPTKGCTSDQLMLLKDSLNSVLDEYNIKDNREEIKEQVMSQSKKMSKLDHSLLKVDNDIDDKITLNLIDSINPCAFMLRFTSGFCGLDTFKAYRDAIHTSKAEWLLELEDYKNYMASKPMIKMTVQEMKLWIIHHRHYYNDNTLSSFRLEHLKASNFDFNKQMSNKFLYKEYPEIEQYYCKSNIIPFKQLTIGMKKKVSIICKDCKSIFTCGVRTLVMALRNNNSGCPYCRGLKVNDTNSLQTKNPVVASQLHKTKNGNLTANNVSEHSNKKLWWTCPICNFDYSMTVVGRSNGSGCRKCANKNSGDKIRKFRLEKNGSLEDNCKKLALLWDYKRNGNITPDMVGCNSNEKFWWTDKKNKMSVNSRYRSFKNK